jgi:hypothetical protein
MAAGDGLVSMAPTSIAYSGTSAGINADGGVDFSAVTSLSLNGVFTSDYDNYLIVFQATAGETVYFRMRASGTDNSTASSYVRQQLSANSTTVSGTRITDNQGAAFNVAGTLTAGSFFHIYGPYLAQPTATRSVNAWDSNSARINDVAGTHNQSTSYDGITFTSSPTAMTGNIHVFGYEE